MSATERKRGGVRKSLKVLLWLVGAAALCGAIYYDVANNLVYSTTSISTLAAAALSLTLITVVERSKK